MAVGDTFNLNPNGTMKEESNPLAPRLEALKIPVPTRSVNGGVSKATPERDFTAYPTSLPMGDNRQLSAGVTTGNTQWDQWVEKYGQKYNIDPDLLVFQMEKESSFRPKVISSQNGKGLMQVTPIAERELRAQKMFVPTNLMDPEQNIHAGAAFLRHMLNKFNNNIPAAVLAYNQGETTVRRNLGNPTTDIGRDYVEKIYNRWTRHIPNRKPRTPASVPSTTSPQTPARPTPPPSGIVDKAKSVWNTYIQPFAPSVLPIIDE
jgi:hypothetical protein